MSVGKSSKGKGSQSKFSGTKGGGPRGRAAQAGKKKPILRGSVRRASDSFRSRDKTERPTDPEGAGEARRGDAAGAHPKNRRPRMAPHDKGAVQKGAPPANVTAKSAAKPQKAPSKTKVQPAVEKIVSSAKKPSAGLERGKTPADKSLKRAPSLTSPPKRKAQTPSSDLAPVMDDDSKKSATFENVADAQGSPDLSESTEDGSGEVYPMSGVDVGMLGIGSPIFPPSADQEAADYTETSDAGWDEDLSVEARIRDLQERLDGLMTTAPLDDLDQMASPTPMDLTPDAADSAVDSAREVLESEYYRKNWGRGAIRQRTFDVDDFGLDPDFEEKVRPMVEFLYRRYFRVEVDGIRNVPATGRAVVVSNHSGALPFDGVMLREAIRTRHPSRNDMRWLAEDFSFYLPFLGVAMNRMGAVRACPENAVRLLEREHLVGVFPEGAEGIKKLFKDRYRLQRFGRGGFVRLCLQTRSPIVPCAIVGAEETNPILFRFDNLSKVLGLDYLPITPTFPWLGPLGLLPAPTKWHIIFGEPISVEEYGPEAAQDHVLVGRLAEQVRTTISNMLETSLRRRKSVWLG